VTAEKQAERATTHDVGKEQLGGVLAVVPVTVVDPLTQQLDRRLRSVLLLGRHVEVVDERYALLAERRPVDALTTPARFTQTPHSQHCQLTSFQLDGQSAAVWPRVRSGSLSEPVRCTSV